MAHVKSIHWVVNWILQLIIEHDVVLLESIEREDQHWTTLVNFDLFIGSHMVLALRAVPRIFFTQFLHLSKLLEAAIQRFRILYGLVLGLGQHAWVHTKALQHIWFTPLLILWELFDEKHDLELEHFVSACLFILTFLFRLFLIGFLRLLLLRLIIPIFIV